MFRLTLNKQNLCFDGQVRFYTYPSPVCQGPMNFSLFLPEQAKTQKCPVLFWLSGLTCNEENFMVKAGAQRIANELGIILVCPDTSPRMAQIVEEEEDYDLGLGAGFYVDATQKPWAQHYQMYRFVAKELPSLIDSEFPTIPEAKGILGHSMGGHGAIVIGLRNPETFRSISAFAPISAPTEAPWGQKAFTAYLGPKKEVWKSYDSSYLLEHAAIKTPILVYQGDADPYLESQLKPERLLKAAQKNHFPLSLQMKAGYDHSYYFMATFISDHLRYHYEILGTYTTNH